MSAMLEGEDTRDQPERTFWEFDDLPPDLQAHMDGWSQATWLLLSCLEETDCGVNEIARAYGLEPEAIEAFYALKRRLITPLSPPPLGTPETLDERAVETVRDCAVFAHALRADYLRQAAKWENGGLDQCWGTMTRVLWHDVATPSWRLLASMLSAAKYLE